MGTILHHLRNKPKSFEQRAKMTASARFNKEKEPKKWQAEYRLKLETLRRRYEIDNMPSQSA